MKTNINHNTIKISMLNKIFLIISLFVLLLSSAYSGIVIIEGNETSISNPETDYNYQYDVLKVSSSYLQFEGSVILSPMESYIVEKEAGKNFHIIQVYNELGNNTMDFRLSVPNNITGNIQFNNYEFTLDPQEQTSMGVYTSSDFEVFLISLQCINGCDNSSLNAFQVVYTLSTHSEEAVTSNLVVSVIETTFIGINEIIEINVGLWRLVYYLAILGVILIALGLLIGFTFKFYEWTDKLSDKKHKIFMSKNDKKRMG